MIRKAAVLTLALILIFTVCIGATALEQPANVTVLFTHDLHSHLLPSPDENGGEYGGYARLKHAINRQKQKNPNAILVDGGDFSMGSLFQTAFATSAIELRMMGAMGYDVTTFGNHEYDYLGNGLASMLNAAANSGDAIPAIVESNYLPPAQGKAGYDAAIHAAFKNYGVREYLILERGGVYFVLFGIFGFDADDCAPNSGMTLLDPTVTAQKIVDKAKAECIQQYGVEPVVICLSHGSTEGGKSEDYELAQNTDGIDLIISGHTPSSPRPLR